MLIIGRVMQYKLVMFEFDLLGLMLDIRDLMKTADAFFRRDIPDASIRMFSRSAGTFLDAFGSVTLSLSYARTRVWPSNNS